MTGLPFINLLPTRKTYGRGAGYTFDPLTGLLVVTTSKKDRRYTITAIPHGFRVTKLDKGTDASEDHYHVERDGFRCCCRGYERFGYCCHSDAVADLDAAGYLEHGEERPVNPEPTSAEIDDACDGYAARLDAEHAIVDAYWTERMRPCEPCPF